MPKVNGAVEIHAGRKLTHADDKDVFIPRRDASTPGGRELCVPMLMDETFTGRDLDSARHNSAMDFRDRKDFDKIAMVDAPRRADWCVKLADLLMKGELRAFPRQQLAQAEQWLRA